MDRIDTQGLISIWSLDGKGGGRRLSWEEAMAPQPEEGFLWLHFRRMDRPKEDWLRQASGLDPSAVESLLEDHARPRCAVFAEGALLSLRGVNLYRNALPEDVVTVHLWVDKVRIVSVQHEPLSAVEDFEDALSRGRCPRTQGEFVAELATRLVERLDAVVNALTDDADELEDQVEGSQVSDLLPRLAVMRRVAIKLRRHIAPQREALNHFSLEDDAWLGPKDRNRLRDAADRVTRFTEELDSVRERAAVIRDQMVDRRAEQMNQSMLVLAVVTVVFAPLTLISGMFGMNVGGIPGSGDGEGFWIVSLILLAIGGLMFWAFKRLRWI
ncbi:zinc transporter ZntB [Xanthobacter pseudotagetidis]|uniref:zinc transporter ZntB n=1 Tax=Xanthobacter pseudotagetidis TaxID=3119911 RepID=UPI0037279860